MIPEIDSSITLEHKRADYNEYILNHINNVKMIFNNLCMVPECRDYIVELLTNDFSDLDALSYNIRTHDLSKFSLDEFDAYRANFYPINDKEKEDNVFAFELAWKHHYQNNPHHWNYWYEKDIVDAMNSIYVIEMFCDHAAMSVKFGGSAIDWFDKQTDIVVGKKQNKIYHNLGNIYYKYYNGKGERIKYGKSI